MPKLPVLKTAALAYRATYANGLALARMAWVWLLLIAVFLAAVIGSAVWLDNRAEAEDPTASAVLAALNPWGDALAFALVLAVFALFAPVAVAWHRLLLRNEATTSVLRLPLTRAIWMYCLFDIFVYGVLFLWEGLVNLLRDSLRDVSSLDLNAQDLGSHLLYAYVLLPGLSFTLILIATVTATRVLLWLPAIALGDDVGLRDIWAATRGNTWRLALGALLCAVVGLIVVGSISIGLTALEEAEVSKWWGVVMLSVILLIVCISVLVELAFLSLAYRHFFPERARREDPVSN